jgi:hypothetical protein
MLNSVLKHIVGFYIKSIIIFIRISYTNISTIREFPLIEIR